MLRLYGRTGQQLRRRFIGKSIMKPQLSIIIPVVNEASQIAIKLQALQPLRDRCQLLLVDGDSDDDSAKIARPRSLFLG